MKGTTLCCTKIFIITLRKHICYIHQIFTNSVKQVLTCNSLGCRMFNNSVLWDQGQVVELPLPICSEVGSNVSATESKDDNHPLDGMNLYLFNIWLQ